MYEGLKNLISEWKRFQDHKIPNRIRLRELKSIKETVERLLADMRKDDSEYNRITEEDLEVLEEILGFYYNL